LSAKLARGRASALGLLLAFSGLFVAGCFGYLTGTYDAEMQRLHTIIAELEAKNAALAEECIGLRKRLRGPERAVPEPSASAGEKRRSDASASDGGPAQARSEPGAGLPEGPGRE